TETDSSGTRASAQYDELNRTTVSVKGVGPNPADQTITTTTYDILGARVKSTGQTTTPPTPPELATDTLDRLSRAAEDRADPRKYTSSTYDVANNQTAIINSVRRAYFIDETQTAYAYLPTPTENRTSYTYDPLNRKIQQVVVGENPGFASANSVTTYA